MSVGIMIITHSGVGNILLQTAFDMLQARPLQPVIIEVDMSCEIDRTVEKAEQAFSRCQQGDGVLILTDIFGSTPSNIASVLLEKHQARAVSGLNLPMLIRVLNYSDLALDQLAEKAHSGGIDGILHWTKT